MANEASMNWIHRILCPVDFSEASARCFAHASSLARWCGASLTVLHVESALEQRLPEPPSEGWSDLRAHLSDTELVRRRLEGLLGRVGAPAAEWQLLVDLGAAVPNILRRGATLPADLIVLGTHSLGGFSHMVLGSVAETVMRRAPCDVLIVPSEAGTQHVPYTSIVCGVDFSDCAQRALARAGELAARSMARLAAVHVISWPWGERLGPDPSGIPPEQAAALNEYQRYLESTAGSRLADELKPFADRRIPTTPFIRHGRAYRELLQVAQERDADLLVLGAHGGGAVDLAIFGSTASQLVRLAAQPVWVVNGPS